MAARSKTASHQPSLLKLALDEYISTRSLAHPVDPRFVLLDEELGRAAGIKRSDPGEKMARDEVLRKLRSGVAWSVAVGGVIK